MTPSDENECRQMLYTGYHYNDGPCAVRYPRGSGTGAPFEPLASLPIGKGLVKREGEKIAILNFGTLLPQAAKVAEKLNATWWICALPNRWMRRWYYSWPQNTRCWSPRRERHHGRCRQRRKRAADVAPPRGSGTESRPA